MKNCCLKLFEKSFKNNPLYDGVAFFSVIYGAYRRILVVYKAIDGPIEVKML